MSGIEGSSRFLSEIERERSEEKSGRVAQSIHVLPTEDTGFETFESKTEFLRMRGSTNVVLKKSAMLGHSPKNIAVEDLDIVEDDFIFSQHRSSTVNLSGENSLDKSASFDWVDDDQKSQIPRLENQKSGTFVSEDLFQ